MTTLEPVARWTAIAIAVAAVIDPAVQLPRRARPAVRVVGNQDGRLRPAAFADGYGAQVMADVTRQLRDAGFALDEPQNEAATVLVADAPDIEHLARSTEHSRVGA